MCASWVKLAPHINSLTETECIYVLLLEYSRPTQRPEFETRPMSRLLRIHRMHAFEYVTRQK